MTATQTNTQSPSFDRLNFSRLQRLLADLGLQAGYWIPGDGEIKGFPPDGPNCGGLCGPAQQGQPFLMQLARDAQSATATLCRQCTGGAVVLAIRMDPAHPDGPIALGCVATGDVEWLTVAFARVVQDWYADSCELAREVEVLSRSLAETYEELSANYRLSEAMNLTASPQAYLEGLAEELRDLLAADAVLISLAPQALPVTGHNAATIVSGHLPMAADVVMASIDPDDLARRGYQVMTIGLDGRACEDGQPAAQVLSTPLARNEHRFGVIAAVRVGTARKVSNIDLTRISSIARNAAVGLENFRLYENMRHLFLGTVRALTRSIDAKDPYTCGHSERVAQLSRRLVLQLGGTGQQADRIYLCGLLHDIGKIGVPEFVLRKPGRLNDEEYARIKRHPAVGAAILDGIHELDDVLPGVLHHHERIDGRGYPDGMSGEQIPLYARVLAVADTFDAMTSARPYRKALSVQVAVEELHRYCDTQFDPAVVQALMQLGPEAIFAELSRIQSGSRPGSVEQAVVSTGEAR